ncbi:hypothetical protein R4I43_04360 [Saccharopolyspora sp. S2-29]|uniref:Uncharacterized protein n=1 Tax=Saccharopolyspora mangrovi TaxID=3082379 RepID=A0ABU6A5E5_9PSEU|nr:hypothetical protein [Saccharopolyspora sp. S2-29]MEB3366630.1 hypothetical protein [Saccharopolyspora sp. S2-29]
MATAVSAIEKSWKNRSSRHFRWDDAFRAGVCDLGAGGVMIEEFVPVAGGFELVADQIGGDSGEPGADVAALVGHGVQTSQRAQEGLAGQVLGHGLVAETGLQVAV